MLSNQKILLTGGAGAIGSSLARKLAEQNKLTILDDLSSGSKSNIDELRNIRFICGSVTDDSSIDVAFENRPDIVFHLAANFANQNSVDHPRKDLEVNGMGTLKILEKCIKSGTKKFIYTSSSCVYGHMEDEMNEECTGHLETPYAISKLLGEHYAKFFHEHYGLDVTLFRLFNSYGPGELPGRYRNVIPNFLASSINGAPLNITGSGEETRCFTFVEDVIDAIVRGAYYPQTKGEVINIGNDQETSIMSLAKIINEITGSRSPIEILPRRPWDQIRRRRPSMIKASKLLKWSATTPLASGLSQYYAWLKPRLTKSKDAACPTQ